MTGGEHAAKHNSVPASRKQAGVHVPTHTQQQKLFKVKQKEGSRCPGRCCPSASK